MSTMKTLVERFVEKVEEPFCAHNDCWIWKGSKYQSKSAVYGQIWSNRRHTAAHRISYELFIGPIPSGYEVHHECENTLCVNPTHLEAITHKINVNRAGHGLETHCKRGHRLDQRNTYLDVRRGFRECRACRRQANLRHQRKGKEGC